jgi:hypothetical protein
MMPMRIARCLVLALLFVAGGAWAKDDLRMLSLTTQDRNGLHVLTIGAGTRWVEASVMSSKSDRPMDRRRSDYPRERFDEVWAGIAALDLSAYKAGPGAGDIGAWKHYVLTVMVDARDRSAQPDVYLVPKCDPPEGFQSLMERLANGLLPEGSPGLLRACESEGGESNITAPRSGQ